MTDSVIPPAPPFLGRYSRQAVAGKRLRPQCGLLQNFDGLLAGATFLLLGLGLVMIASASISTADRELGEPLYYFWRQMVYVLFGLLLLSGVVRVPLRFWQRAGALLWLVGILLLIVVLIPGVGYEVNGSIRWIRLGFMNFQPSELMKLAMIIYLAGYLMRRAEEVRGSWWGSFKPIALMGFVSVLLLAEPDYGTVAVLFATTLSMLFLGGVPLRNFTPWAGIIGLVLAALISFAPYRVERLMTFLKPWDDPFGSGYQLTQALIAIGRGEWFGVGLGNSVLKLFYLPEAHTDFLFAVLAEELGLAGIVLVVCLYAFLCWRSFAIARGAEQKEWLFAAYLAYGLGFLLGLQAFINIGVNMGILPTKGLTLPLMSYGGSSVVMNCCIVGLLLRTDHELRGRG